jgi:hypothetical protein
MNADILTKPLNGQLFKNMRSFLLGEVRSKIDGETTKIAELEETTKVTAS